MKKKIMSTWTYEKARWTGSEFVDRTVSEPKQKELTMSIFSNGAGELVLAFHGGPTGHETYYVRDIIEGINDPKRGNTDFCICAGSINSWAKCTVNRGEVANFLSEFLNSEPKTTERITPITEDERAEVINKLIKEYKHNLAGVLRHVLKSMEIDDLHVVLKQFKLDTKPLWWGYLHSSGTVHLKRYWNDPGDIKEAKSSTFCVLVVEPFDADSKEEAMKELKHRLFA